MDPTAMLAGGVTGLVIAVVVIALIVVIYALLVMLGAKLVMGSAARFGSAVIATIANLVVGLIAGLVLGAVLGMLLPGQMMLINLVSIPLSALIAAWLYSSLVRTNDDRKPSFLQGFLIWLVQTLIVLAVAIVIVLVAVFVFQVQLPTTPGAL